MREAKFYKLMSKFLIDGISKLDMSMVVLAVKLSCTQWLGRPKKRDQPKVIHGVTVIVKNGDVVSGKTFVSCDFRSYHNLSVSQAFDLGLLYEFKFTDNTFVRCEGIEVLRRFS